MKFRGHETFAIRKGWLNKGIKNIQNNSGVFTGHAGNPMDVLGIGSNMIKSLRYWMIVTGIAAESNSRRKTQSLTELGQIIKEYDPYFEELGSLALVHYEIATNEKLATAWYIFFHHFDYIEFSEDDFQSSVKKYVHMQTENEPPSERSVSDDFKCIINTYYAKDSHSNNPEDHIECPLVELGLVEYLYTKKGIRFYKKVMIKESLLPDLIALAMIIKQADSQKEIKISSLVREHRSIGRLFHLDMVRVIGILYRLEKHGYLKVVRTAGLDVVKITTDLNFLDCIRLYYKKLSE